MASPNVWPNGLAGSGFELATVTNDFFSGDVWWLDTVNGADGASPAGKEREQQLKTLAQAHTNAVAGDIIVIESGSAETLAVSQSLNKAGITILGLGTGATRPRYTCSGAVDLLSITAAGVRIYNMYFPASTGASTSRIKTAAAESEINGCYFECGTNDTAVAVSVAATLPVRRISVTPLGLDGFVDSFGELLDELRCWETDRLRTERVRVMREKRKLEGVERYLIQLWRDS